MGQCAVSLSSAEKPVVLLADPDVEFVKLLAIRLVNEGLEVRAVSSAEEALLKVLDQPPHIVLASAGSDPERLLHLVEQVRQDAKLRLMPLLLLVENDDRIFKTRALRAGADDVLRKRIDLQDIVVKVESVLAREAARQSSDEDRSQRGITGQLENLALPDIFQILSLGLKTARLTLEDNGRSGAIWFANGSAVHAETQKKTGTEACFDMLRWKTGKFCIEHGLTTEASTIEMETMMVVMEGLRLLDEEGAPVGDQEAG
jgi:DNA-binding response OmpR family regulator